MNSFQKVADELQQLLANEFVLYTKTLNYHWNIESPHFGALHKLLDTHYRDLQETIDRVAERIRALGFKTQATLQEYLHTTTLKEKPNDYPADLQMIRNLVHDHEHIIKQLRTISSAAEEANDTGTANMIGDICEQQEKMAWMLRSHLV